MRGCLFPGCKNYSLELTFPGKHNEIFISRNFSKKVFGCQFLFLGFFSKKWVVPLIDLMPYY